MDVHESTLVVEKQIFRIWVLCYFYSFYLMVALCRIAFSFLGSLAVSKDFVHNTYACANSLESCRMPELLILSWLS